MPMDLESFRKLIRQIYATQDQELDCEGFFEAIPKYVDAEVAGEEAKLRFPEVAHHLMQCPRCRELYRGVHDAALAESREEAEQLVPVRRSECSPNR
jgi:predicted anti-sigma-YlaC factor YlaD